MKRAKHKPAAPAARNAAIMLRVTATERALFRQRAQAEARSLSSWMRYHLLKVAEALDVRSNY